MPHIRLSLLTLGFLTACGGAGSTASPTTASHSARMGSTESSGAAAESTSDRAQAASGEDAPEFQTQDSTTARGAHGVAPSKIKATKTEAAMKFFVVDREKNEPISGIVIALEAPDGTKFYTEETDAAGYAEVLVPVGQRYSIVYLSLGHTKISAKVTVSNEPNQNIKLTLRYKGRPAAKGEAPGFRLDGVSFKSGSAELLPESFPRLDTVVEYMTHKKSARVEVSGHTDNVGAARTNKALSQKRADACKRYLVSKGIAAGRIDAIGYGDARPIASNDNDTGRQKNRRIEVREVD